jgi:hypothetical protein
MAGTLALAPKMAKEVHLGSSSKSVVLTGRARADGLHLELIAQHPTSRILQLKHRILKGHCTNAPILLLKTSKNIKNGIKPERMQAKQRVMADSIPRK